MDTAPPDAARHDDGEPFAIDTRTRLGDVLVDVGVLAADELERALETQSSAGTHRRLGRVLVDLGLTTERQIAEALAEQLRLTWVDLNAVVLDPQVVRQLPRGVAFRLGAVLLHREGDRLTVAVSDPTDVVALDDIRLHTRASELVVQVATESQIAAHLTRVWSLSQDASDVTTFFEDADLAARPTSMPTPRDGGAFAPDDAPTVRLVTMVLADAVRAGASDVHVEPQRDRLRIRYRVDGLLREVMTVPRSATASVVSRLKIVSGLDIAERRVPQDGRTRIAVDGVEIDARVSSMPSMHGEKIVVRLLARDDVVPDLADAGLDPEQLADLRRAVAAPQGLVLITGPTGSGKTSTLFAALREIHTPDRNIITLEDPVEVQLPGLTQVQVDERTGLTFSRGLRAVLRQDPDVVLVGEVRDTETAELAVRASLTGHLVLTTLHTNGAVAALTRLVDMGVEPFMVGSALTAVVGQRLVRRPCPGCLVEHQPDPRILARLGVDPDRATAAAGATLVHGTGCADCGGSGYRGRHGVFEVILVDPALRSVLANEPTESRVSAALRGATTLREAAVRLALAGGTTFEEVERISPPD